MADIQKNADELAQKLANALRQDGFIKQAMFITEAEARVSRTAQVLKEAEANLDFEDATEDEREKVAGDAAEKLQLNRKLLRRLMKEASNDNYVSVADYIDQILGKK